MPTSSSLQIITIQWRWTHPTDESLLPLVRKLLCLTYSESQTLKIKSLASWSDSLGTYWGGKQTYNMHVRCITHLNEQDYNTLRETVQTRLSTRFVKGMHHSSSRMLLIKNSVVSLPLTPALITHPRMKHSSTI